MARMVRKQMYISEAQDRMLKARARRLGVTESEVIRSGLDRMLRSELGEMRDPEAWARLVEFMEERQNMHVPPGSRTWTRDGLYGDDE